ncbi:hypothetical protein HGRIS_009033 [Hohenbuehelia grisea]|uniref:mRNA 3'-end-processing protein RNA14 n=1 Tax=Hohenbuehelia grisea TaxID=104357 RepID=A0ABR3J1B3_9AGAR
MSDTIQPPAVETGGDLPTTEASGDATQTSEDIARALSALTASATFNSPSPAQSGGEPMEQDRPSEYDLLKQQLKAKPQDSHGWLRLINIAEDSSDPEKIKDAYDLLLQQFPNTVSAQIAYLSHFLSDHRFLELLFKRFLRSSPSVELWKFYLSYVVRLNSKPNMRDAIDKAYEFALNYIGQDKDSGEIWADYIAFIKAGTTSSTWEEQQKMDALRKVYHRAVQLPIENVEKLWQDLEAFENGLNRITAKKFMTDLSPAHMQARTALRQLQKHVGPLYPPQPASQATQLVLPSLPTYSPAERALVGAWKAYLKWEESNPLEFEERDRATFVSRVQMVYRKAVVRMRYYSEIWFMAYIWTMGTGKEEESLGILEAGIKANPGSFLLNFAYAEAQENRKKFPEVHTTFENLLETLRKQLEEQEQTINSTNSSQASTVPAGATSTPPPDDGSPPKDASFSSQSSESKPPKSKELSDRRAEYGVAYIMYIRFVRRAEGVKAARALFFKCRKDRWTPWQVYEAVAMLEYHSFDDKGIAGRIFERGMEMFPDELPFVLQYLTFLLNTNDENNARALFERVVPTFPPEEARQLWERWARYEYQFGNLEAAQKLEKRIAEAFPADTALKRFAQRYMYLGIDAIASRDLGVSMARATVAPTAASTSGNQLGRTESQASLAFNSPKTGHKRPSSPDHRNGRDDGRKSDHAPLAKRQRAQSPPARDRDRDRWDGPPRRRHSPPPVPPPRGRDRERDREEERPPLPTILPWFLSQLPTAASFDGPIFRTDDLVTLFKNAVIPSNAAARPKSPPVSAPPRGGGRPPPDYSPYTGPGGGRGGRRY